MISPQQAHEAVQAVIAQQKTAAQAQGASLIATFQTTLAAAIAQGQSSCVAASSVVPLTGLYLVVTGWLTSQGWNWSTVPAASGTGVDIVVNY